MVIDASEGPDNGAYIPFSISDCAKSTCRVAMILIHANKKKEKEKELYKTIIVINKTSLIHSFFFW